MDIKELRRKLRAETRTTLTTGDNWADEEVGEFLSKSRFEEWFPDEDKTPHGFLSERAMLLSDEELMFRWAVFKM